MPAAVEATAERLLPSCVGLSAQYAYLPDAEAPEQGLVWLNQWEYPQELPRLLKVSLQLETREELERLMWIPAGVLKTLAEEAPEE
jgi:hypothetical protein